ncbi:recombinase family protein [Paludibacterium paludis]|uniref:recombinase family protein n=1 Tax=Paludibacterium paludis TaxID=1225769 RepID=UPI00167BDB6A|nr:recombinase family protein [Paludibacterium paludis]
MYDEVGNVELDLDAQVREIFTHYFETFSRVRSAHQTVLAFKNEGILFPSRVRNEKRTTSQPLTASTALRAQNNPRYAGVHGRRHYRRTVDGKTVQRKRERDDWLTCISDAHASYFSR